MPDGGPHDPGNTDRSATFQLLNNVTLEGGYAGYGEADQRREPNLGSPTDPIRAASTRLHDCRIDRLQAHGPSRQAAIADMANLSR